MSAPILATKIYIPPVRPDLVYRSGLVSRLNQGIHGKLTLISAPAGFGKTTLASEWATQCDCPVAWLSLDGGDNHLTLFLRYLIAALQTMRSVAPATTPENDAKIGESVLSLLESPQPPPRDSILAALVNDLITVPHNFLVILDDYHVIETPAIDEALTFLLDHMPPQMHLAITSREDPNLPLARYRARGQLTELRATDLRFTAVEAAQFLNQSMGLTLAEKEITALETRTEGWIAGLQMAALSMQGRAKPDQFIQAFTGSHRFVLDYLVEEVLQSQPEHIRHFLMQTAILNRLSGPLCDAVTEAADGRAMLETLERGNLFIVPLDDQRQWYRYHHLFADFLQARLSDEMPHHVPDLHRRASDWCEQKGLLTDAVQHALTAEEFERAADLIELARPSLEKGTRDTIFRGWMQLLPAQIIRERPSLSIGYAWALLDAGELEAAKEQLQHVEHALEAVDRSSTKSKESSQLHAIRPSLATAWVYYAQANRDIPKTIDYSKQALNTLPEDDYLRRGQVTGLLGLAYWGIGDLEAALQSVSDANAYIENAGTVFDTINSRFVPVDMLITLGRLREAMSICEQGLALAKQHGEPMPLGTEDVHSGQSDLYRERNELDRALESLAASERLGRKIGTLVWRYRWSLAQAQVKAALGEFDAALALLDEAESIYIRNPLPNVRPIGAIKARVWIKQGKFAQAVDWARARRLSTNDELSYLQEYEHITLARLLIAQNAHDPLDAGMHPALGLLARLLEAADVGQRMGSVIEILVLQAIAHNVQGRLSLALAALKRALAIAEPEGYVRLFVDEGQPMAALLKEAAAQQIMPEYANKLLTACRADGGISSENPTTSSIASPLSSTQPLIEPLSARELDVLRLLQTELSGPEIANELVVALSTVRTHTKSIYGKLNVNNRRAAVKRASELGLM